MGLAHLYTRSPVHKTTNACRRCRTRPDHSEDDGDAAGGPRRSAAAAPVRRVAASERHAWRRRLCAQCCAVPAALLSAPSLMESKPGKCDLYSHGSPPRVGRARSKHEDQRRSAPGQGPDMRQGFTTPQITRQPRVGLVATARGRLLRPFRASPPAQPQGGQWAAGWPHGSMRRRVLGRAGVGDAHPLRDLVQVT